MTDRETFEAWYSDGGESPMAVMRNAGGGYMLMQACSAWVAWQAAWAACRTEALEYAAKLCDKRVMGDHNREDAEAKRCAEAIRATIGKGEAG